MRTRNCNNIKQTYIACLDSFSFDTLTPLDKDDRETVLLDLLV